MYILNLVLGCWLTENDASIEPCNTYLTAGHIQSLKGLSDYWNARNKQTWAYIHYPCRPEHFEAYEKLPPDWKRLK